MTTKTTAERGERVLAIDPLRLLDFSTVVKRTGYSRAYIEKLLARDHMARRPGRSFPTPLTQPGGSDGGKPRRYWRELRIVEWIESREAVDAR